MIKKEGGKFVLYSKDGSKKLGSHATKAKAIAQEIAIKMSKKEQVDQPENIAGTY